MCDLTFNLPSIIMIQRKAMYVVQQINLMDNQKTYIMHLFVLYEEDVLTNLRKIIVLKLGMKYSVI